MMILNIFILIFIICIFIVIISNIIMLYKYRKYLKILDLVFLYNVDCKMKNIVPLVSLADVIKPEKFFNIKILLGKTRPISKNKYKIIKPYMKEYRKRKKIGHLPYYVYHK